MAFSPRNIVGCLLKKRLQRGVTGTPGPPSLRPCVLGNCPTLSLAIIITTKKKCLQIFKTNEMEECKNTGKKKKKEFPSSRIRTSDLRMSTVTSTVLRSTNWAIEGSYNGQSDVLIKSNYISWHFNNCNSKFKWRPKLDVNCDLYSLYQLSYRRKSYRDIRL